MFRFHGQSRDYTVLEPLLTQGALAGHGGPLDVAARPATASGIKRAGNERVGTIPNCPS